MAAPSSLRQKLPQPASNGVLFASGGVLLLVLLQPLPPLLTLTGVVAMLALMLAGIALEWRQSGDDVQKDAARSSAIGAMPVAFICSLLAAVAVLFWPGAWGVLAAMGEEGGDRAFAMAFALGVVSAFFWLFVVYFVLLFTWWSRHK